MNQNVITSSLKKYDKTFEKTKIRSQKKSEKNSTKMLNTFCFDTPQKVEEHVVASRSSGLSAGKWMKDVLKLQLYNCNYNKTTEKN